MTEVFLYAWHFPEIRETEGPRACGGEDRRVSMDGLRPAWATYCAPLKVPGEKKEEGERLPQICLSFSAKLNSLPIYLSKSWQILVDTSIHKKKIYISGSLQKDRLTWWQTSKDSICFRSLQIDSLSKGLFFLVQTAIQHDLQDGQWGVSLWSPQLCWASQVSRETDASR